MTNLKIPVQVSTENDANDQLLYFTSSSLTADDNGIVMISDRTGHPNLFHKDLSTGTETQLSFNDENYLKSYVYFDGTPYKGFARASTSLSKAGFVFYIQGNQVMRSDLQGNNKVLAELPADVVTAFTHVSEDGTRLCIPVTDARALRQEILDEGDLPRTIDRHVQAESLSSWLLVYDTESGELIHNEEVPKAWITHVQFSPTNNDHILYNHEWASDWGIRRMWLWDGSTHSRMREEGDGRTKKDWACHEFWERDGEFVIYHGGLENGRNYVGRVNRHGKNNVEIQLDAKYWPYGHFTSGRDGWLVSDGYYTAAEEDQHKGTGQWICLVKVDWAAATLEWIPLCRNESSWSSQDAHPHPIFNHGGNAVYYTSDKPGKRSVFSIDVTDIVGD